MNNELDKTMENMKSRNTEEADIVMTRAAEALELLAEYGTSFTREIDRDETCSMLSIISDYLMYHAEKTSD